MPETPADNAGDANGAPNDNAGANAPDPVEAARQEERQRAAERLSGLEGKRDELLGEVKASKTRLRDIETRLGGRDLDALLDMAQKMEADESAAMLAAGDIEGVRKKAVEATTAAYEAKLETETGTRKAIEAERDQYKAQVATLVIDNEMQRAFVAAGGNPKAVQSMLAVAHTNWSLNDAGEREGRDEHGVLLKGKDGLMTPDEYMSERLRVEHDYLFRPVAGGGAAGNAGAPSGAGKYPPKAKMTAQQKAEASRELGREAYMKLP